MRRPVGTSGYSDDHREGDCRPPGRPSKERLSFHAARFDTVGINHTVHRMPGREVLADRMSAVARELSGIELP